jgi:hypothetical protein
VLRLLYFSNARADLDSREVDEIVKHAAQSNSKKGITGALAYNGRNFCQLLEGPEQEVRKLVEVIRNDDRHSGFKVIDEREVEQAHFSDWSMHRVGGLDFSTVINAMQS